MKIAPPSLKKRWQRQQWRIPPGLLKQVKLAHERENRRREREFAPRVPLEDFAADLLRKALASER